MDFVSIRGHTCQRLGTARINLDGPISRNANTGNTKIDTNRDTSGKHRCATRIPDNRVSNHIKITKTTQV